jgi:nucleotide-binding universal stress UspA family protein
MERTIVCAVDERMSGEVAATVGELAAALDAQVVLVHVQPDPPLLPGSVDERERARHRVIRRGMAILSDAADVVPAELDVALRAEVGLIAEMVSQVAEEENAALLVAGCRRRGALASTILGSVSHDLAREAPCPVVIVPRRTSSRAERRRRGLVVGIDGSEQSVIAAGFASELSRQLGDRVVLVHSDAPPRRPAAVLRDAAIREQARFIVIGPPDQDALRPSMISSVAAELPRHSPCPVIVVRASTASHQAEAT